MKPAQPNKSLMDGIDLLLALVNVGEPIGVRELARRVGMETTRCQRLLATLAVQGMAEQDADRKYRPGPGIHVLSTMSLAASGLLQRALPHLRQLAGVAPIVALGVLWRDEMCYLYHGSGAPDDDQAFGRMTHFPATQSALGMAILAASDPERVVMHIGAAQAKGLESQLAEIRLCGYALMPQASQGNQGYSLGVAIGSPVYAAIGISGAFGPVDAPSLAEQLAAAAAAIDQTAH